MEMMLRRRKGKNYYINTLILEKHMSTCKAKSKLSLGNWITAESAIGFQKKIGNQTEPENFQLGNFSWFLKASVRYFIFFMFQLSSLPTSIGITTIMCYSHLLSCPFWKAETMSFSPLWLLYQARHLPHDDQ